ncbi:MAG: ArsR/SmtB family transcription factor [Candidatus Woesearchaeota archaeon]
MRVEYLYSGSKWAILEELAKQPRSTSELAKTLNTSQANISQQLKHLELAGIITRKRTQRKNIHYTYEITATYLHLVTIGPGVAQQHTNKATNHEQLLATLYTHKHQIPLLSLVLTRAELFKQAQTIAVLNREQPELLVLAENVTAFRENASTTIHTLIGQQTIAIWSHTPEELAEGLHKQEPYYKDLLKDATIAYDPSGELRKQRGNNQ